MSLICKLYHINNLKHLGYLHVWNVEHNIPLAKEYNADSQTKKTTKSITNLIYNEARSTLAICYVDNTVALKSFGEQNSENMVCFILLNT